MCKAVFCVISYCRYFMYFFKFSSAAGALAHGLQTPREDIAFTARPKIQSQSQIFRYGQSIFCLLHRPNFSDIFDLWVSVVRAGDKALHPKLYTKGAFTLA